jgi:hypothetical protein
MAATDELRVVITGKDGASQVFEAVGKKGRQAGQEIERGAKQGGAGLRKL